MAKSDPVSEGVVRIKIPIEVKGLYQAVEDYMESLARADRKIDRLQRKIDDLEDGASEEDDLSNDQELQVDGSGGLEWGDLQARIDEQNRVIAALRSRLVSALNEPEAQRRRMAETAAVSLSRGTDDVYRLRYHDGSEVRIWHEDGDPQIEPVEPVEKVGVPWRSVIVSLASLALYLYLLALLSW